MTNHKPPLIQLDTFWPYQAVVLADLVSRHTRDILKSHTDLNISQWRVMAAIAEKPGRSSVEVVAITPMDKGIVSRAVATLIEAGLARKLADPSDRRRAALELTDLGYKKYERVAKALMTALASEPSITANNENLSSMLTTYIEHMTAIKASD